MARSKKVAAQIPSDNIFSNKGSREIAEELSNLFDDYATEKFGSVKPPKAYLTPSGVRPLDALLGGGFVSSSMITFCSTPETGKSTIAYQIAKQFLNTYDNSIVVYFDLESAGAEIEENNSFLLFSETRADTFGLSRDKRFKYDSRPYSIKEIFEYIEGLFEKKREIQEKTQSEVKILIIFDSFTVLQSDKFESQDSFDGAPAMRARELTFYLSKFKKSLLYHRPTVIAIDQVRANLSIKSKYEKPDEKTIGNYSGFKSASGITSYQLV